MGIAFAGIPGIRGVRCSLTRGITPSAFCLYCLPFDGLDVSSGTLEIEQGGNTVGLTDCAVSAAFLEKRDDPKDKYPLWKIWGVDRRWRWQFGTISGTYNTAIPPVNPSKRKSAQQLMALCLDAMGESGYDVSNAPNDVYPLVNWKGETPAIALANLCDYVACEVVLNWQSNKVEIWPLGVGGGAGEGVLHAKYRFVPRTNVPSQIEVHCGESLYQFRLRLKPIGRQGNLQEKFLHQVDWGGSLNNTESFTFPNVAGTSNGSAAVNQALALATGWRQYQVVGQENGALAVPSCPVNVTSTEQYDLKDYILFSVVDINGNLQLLPPYIEGDYWSYADLPNNTSNQIYIGDFKLFHKRQIAEFPYPMVKMTSTGALEAEGAVLYLHCAYAVKDENGNPNRLTKFVNLGGAGGKLILKRPELVAGYTFLGNTESTVAADADKYLNLFSRKFANPLAAEVTIPGIVPLGLDGNVSQVSWSYFVNRPPQTTVCEQEELDTWVLGRSERRRRELVRHLVETRA